jgi:hypothetical protein
MPFSARDRHSVGPLAKGFAHLFDGLMDLVADFKPIHARLEGEKVPIDFLSPQSAFRGLLEALVAQAPQLANIRYGAVVVCLKLPVPGWPPIRDDPQGALDQASGGRLVQGILVVLDDQL